jgi:hypothetical protein
MHSVSVTLCPKEMMVAGLNGQMRQVENVRKKYRPPTMGCGHFKDWQLHVEGALAEWAVAKHLGVYPSGFEFGSGDLGRYEVRSSPNPKTLMYMKPTDKDDHIFIRVTGVNGDYQIHGWITGKDGKQFPKEDKYNNDRPAIWVPYAALKPMSELPRNA